MTVRRILDSKPKHDILTIRPDASVADAARILSENRIGALVVSATGQSLDGMLSERDIVRELGKRGPECLNDRVHDLMTAEVVTAAPDDVAVTALEKMTVWSESTTITPKGASVRAVAYCVDRRASALIRSDARSAAPMIARSRSSP